MRTSSPKLRMRIKLAPSYYLTDEIGETPRLVHRLSEQNYCPDNISPTLSRRGRYSLCASLFVALWQRCD